MRITYSALVAGALLVSGPTSAALVEIGPSDNLISAAGSLQPGDTLQLRGGLYTLTSRFSIGLDCTAGLPCVIQSKPGELAHINRPNQNQNIVDIEFSNYLTLQGIEFSGGSRGIRIRESSHITLENNHIHDTGDAAVAANDSGSQYDGLRLIRNHIHDTNGTGEGMYLGCNFDACQMFNSVIEGNYIHDTDGPTVSQGDGIEIKEGSWGNVVRDNVIHDTGYPCIITYSTVGNGGPNVLERNLMWGCGDHAIQSAADSVIRNNIILGAAFDGIRSQPHQSGTPQNLVITHNTILAPSANALRLSGVVGPVTVANNALYAQAGSALRVDLNGGSATVVGNVGSGSVQGVVSGFDSSGSLADDFVAASYSGTVPQDLFPTASSALVGAAAPAWLADDDFDALLREGSADAGAYNFTTAGGPSWPLGPGFKPTDDELPMFADGFEDG